MASFPTTPRVHVWLTVEAMDRNTVIKRSLRLLHSTAARLAIVGADEPTPPEHCAPQGKAVRP